MSPSILVIGIGNRYRRDDGSALLVLEAVAERLPAGVAAVESDGDPARMIDLWTGVDLAVVLETVRSGNPPGTVVCFEGDELLRDASARSGGEHGSHSLGLLEAVELARALGRTPRRWTVVGIEPEDLGWGEGVSTPVAAAIGMAATAVLDLVVAGHHGNLASAASQGGHAG